MKTFKLNKADQVSLQSCSGGMAGEKQFLHRFIIGKARVEELNLVPKVSAHALKGIKYLKNNPEKRAKDLMDAFKAKNIKAIIANIGGFDSHELIPFLDQEIIKNNPKPILGYSDITSLHLFLYTLGIKTYYGPTVLDGFAENVKMHSLTKQSLEKVLFNQGEQIIVSSPEWTSEFLDWSNPKYDDVQRKMQKEEKGHIWINFKEEIEGKLIGGCLDTIVQIKELPFFPNLEHWKNKVIFLETSEQKMEPHDFRNNIIKLEKELNSAKAIIFGKPKDEEYFDEYLTVVKDLINKPIVFNLNYGHTAPMYTLPYDSVMVLEPKKKQIIIK